MFLGVDVASVDGNKPIDWQAAKRAGCRFAIIRGTYVEWADPTWRAEHDRARAAGLLVGAYLFPDMRAVSPDAQVAAFSTAVPIDAIDLPPVLDVEFPGGIAKTGRTRADLLDWIRRAVAALRRSYDAAPMIYTSARVWDGTDADSLAASKSTPPELVDCPLWLARYPYAYRTAAHVGDADALPRPTSPAAWGPDACWIHQYQGDAVGLPGFSSTVDLNRFFALALGDKGSRVRWAQQRIGMAEGTPGVFDGVMEDAVRRWQGAKGLLVDGVIGPASFARLWKP